MAEGKLDDHFPLRVWQTGSGTQTNMNANEVIANRAIELDGGVMGTKTPVHPNDHVNMSQSSNDTFPTAMHIAAAEEIVRPLLPSVRALHDAFAKKADAFADITKIGRTHLMDAVPLTLGQEFSGYVAQLDADLHIEPSLPGLYELAAGGRPSAPASTPRPNSPSGWPRRIAELTGLPFVTAPNKFAALAAHDALATPAAPCGRCCSLLKIANDIRWLGSGPRSGLGEIVLPENEPGSSIMPGKVNPTQCEAMTMVCIQVMGNDTAIGVRRLPGQLRAQRVQAGHHLQPAALGPPPDRRLPTSASLVEGLEPDTEQIKRHLENSLMLVTALTRHRLRQGGRGGQAGPPAGTTLREAALELGYLSGEQFDDGAARGDDPPMTAATCSTTRRWTPRWPRGLAWDRARAPAAQAGQAARTSPRPSPT